MNAHDSKIRGRVRDTGRQFAAKMPRRLREKGQSAPFQNGSEAGAHVSSLLCTAPVSLDLPYVYQ